ncbi:MAG: hypothetical protein GY861_10715 [bacterium]|nr:hypothetical protein [bacterium]
MTEEKVKSDQLEGMIEQHDSEHGSNAFILPKELWLIDYLIANSTGHNGTDPEYSVENCMIGAPHVDLRNGTADLRHVQRRFIVPGMHYIDQLTIKAPETEGLCADVTLYSGNTQLFVPRGIYPINKVGSNIHLKQGKAEFFDRIRDFNGFLKENGVEKETEYAIVTDSDDLLITQIYNVDETNAAEVTRETVRLTNQVLGTLHRTHGVEYREIKMPC